MPLKVALQETAREDERWPGERLGGAGLSPLERLRRHYESLRDSRPGPLLDRIYARLVAQMGGVAPVFVPVAPDLPPLDRVPLASLGEEATERARTRVGQESLEAYVRSPVAGDPLWLVRRAVAIRALGRLTKDEAIQAYAVYLKERYNNPELEKVVRWLL